MRYDNRRFLKGFEPVDRYDSSRYDDIGMETMEEEMGYRNKAPTPIIGIDRLSRGIGSTRRHTDEYGIGSMMDEIGRSNFSVPVGDELESMTKGQLEGLLNDLEKKKSRSKKYDGTGVESSWKKKEKISTAGSNYTRVPVDSYSAMGRNESQAEEVEEAKRQLDIMGRGIVQQIGSILTRQLGGVYAAVDEIEKRIAKIGDGVDKRLAKMESRISDIGKANYESYEEINRKYVGTIRAMKILHGTAADMTGMYALNVRLEAVRQDVKAQTQRLGEMDKDFKEQKERIGYLCQNVEPKDDPEDRVRRGKIGTEDERFYEESEGQWNFNTHTEGEDERRRADDDGSDDEYVIERQRDEIGAGETEGKKMTVLRNWGDIDSESDAAGGQKNISTSPEAGNQEQPDGAEEAVMEARKDDEEEEVKLAMQIRKVKEELAKKETQEGEKIANEIDEEYDGMQSDAGSKETGALDATSLEQEQPGGQAEQRSLASSIEHTPVKQHTPNKWSVVVKSGSKSMRSRIPEQEN
jgi:hypothetical protein